MPPKPTVSVEDVLSAALSLVRMKGIESVNARSLAEVLGCSTKPLFRLYKNMDELKWDLFSHINKHCSGYLLDYNDLKKGPIGLALRYISLARSEPNLFKAMFMSGSISQTTIVDMLTDKDIEPLLKEISEVSKLSRREALAIYKKMWLLSHGVASIIATNGNVFEMEEVECMLNDAYKGFVVLVK